MTILIYSGKPKTAIEVPIGATPSTRPWRTFTGCDLPNETNVVQTLLCIEVSGKLVAGKDAGWFMTRMRRVGGNPTAAKKHNVVTWPGGRFSYRDVYVWFGARKMEEVTWEVQMGDYIESARIETDTYCKAVNL